MNDAPFPALVNKGYVYLYNLSSLDENEENGQKFTFYIMTLYSMNLKQFIKKTSGISYIKDIFEVAYQLIGILKLVHRAKMTFNDLKPENIMITPPGKDNTKLQVHLIDFGFADKYIDDKSKEHIKEGETVDKF